MSIRIPKERSDLATTVPRFVEEIRTAAPEQLVGGPAVINPENDLSADEVGIIWSGKGHTGLFG